MSVPVCTWHLRLPMVGTNSSILRRECSFVLDTNTEFWLEDLLVQWITTGQSLAVLKFLYCLPCTSPYTVDVFSLIFLG